MEGCNINDDEEIGHKNCKLWVKTRLTGRFFSFIFLTFDKKGPFKKEKKSFCDAQDTLPHSLAENGLV